MDDLIPRMCDLPEEQKQAFRERVAAMDATDEVKQSLLAALEEEAYEGQPRMRRSDLPGKIYRRSDWPEGYYRGAPDS